MSTFHEAQARHAIEEQERKEAKKKLEYYSSNKDLEFEKIKAGYKADWEAHKPYVIETDKFYSIKLDINKTVKHRKILNTLTKEVKK